MHDLKNKAAVVTGAESGIGRAIAKELSSCGAKVLIVYKDDWQEAKKTQKGCKGKTVLCQADLSSTEECQKIVDCAMEAFGKIDILVNNAGVIIRKPFLRTTEKEYDITMAVNLKAVYFLSQAVAAKMRTGSIINISSFRAIKARPGLSVYDISKAAVSSLTQNLADELSPHIRVNAIAPGVIDTNMVKELSVQMRQQLLAQIPARRFGRPEEVAKAAAFLASDDAAYITGTILGVDGGILDV